MKAASKKIIIFALISPIMVLSMISPTLAIETPQQQQAACTRIATLQADSQTKLETGIAKMQADFTGRLTMFASNKTEVEKRVTANRANARAKFEERILKLESR